VILDRVLLGFVNSPLPLNFMIRPCLWRAHVLCATYRAHLTSRQSSRLRDREREDTRIAEISRLFTQHSMISDERPAIAPKVTLD
jgi:hypothetical protein